MYDPVLAALRRGAADDALLLARELVDTRPDDVVAHRLLAQAQRLGGDDAGALATLDAALERDPHDADAHVDRAALLARGRQLDEAEAALARATGVDPNQFDAYVLRAQLAMGRGELDEAERLVRTAARIAPEHPQLLAVEGTILLRRGRPDQALALLARAAGEHPDDPMLRHALGFAHLANGHLAFAEQAFRGLFEHLPDPLPMRLLVAELMRRQGQAEAAADELEEVLAGRAPTPAAQRLMGELALEAGRAGPAVERLKQALALAPDDRRTLSALLAAWERLEDRVDARNTLDAALATHPQAADLWLARLGVEPFAGDEAVAVVDRWLAAMPDHVPALTARMTLLDARGDAAGAEAIAQRLVALQPGHGQAELRLLDALIQREPDVAVDRLKALVERAPDPGVRRGLRQLLGHAYDRAGYPAHAVETWAALHAEVAAQRLPLPAPTGFAGPWPAPGGGQADAGPATCFLWGAPGSLVERLARALDVVGAPVRTDRFGAQAPHDAFQRAETAARLADGSLAGADVAAQWRAALAGRGLAGDALIDWLPLWDNAYLRALRPHLPGALVLFALRDPRDMLLDWLAFGSPVPLRMDSPLEAARWLAATLAQVADVADGNLVGHRLLRLDGIENDAAAIAQALSAALDSQVPAAPAPALGPPRLPAGHWRRFAGALDEAFAALGPVAGRLGYAG